MTGQVKEDIISRYGELGVFVNEGKLFFKPSMLRNEEFLDTAQVFNYIDVESKAKQIELPERSLAFTYCQIPIVYKIADKNSLKVIYKDNKIEHFNGLTLDAKSSTKIFERSGEVVQIIASVNSKELK